MITRVALRVYRDPGEADVFLNIRAKDGGIETLAPVIDTGAETQHSQRICWNESIIVYLDVKE